MGTKRKKEIKFYTEEDNGLSPKVTIVVKFFRKTYLQNQSTFKKKAEEKASRIAIRILKLNP